MPEPVTWTFLDLNVTFDFKDQLVIAPCKTSTHKSEGVVLLRKIKMYPPKTRK